jgi:integrase
MFRISLPSAFGCLHSSISPFTSIDLLLLKEQSSEASPEAFIFPNADGGFVDPTITASGCRILARDLNLPKLTFEVIRRTIATLAQKKGTVKDIERLLRHSRAATTTDVYMQETPASVQVTVEAISRELLTKTQTGKGG